MTGTTIRASGSYLSIVAVNSDPNAAFGIEVPFTLSAISASHTKLANGASFLVAGSNITITTASNGQIFIASTIPSSGGDPGATYLTLVTTASLSNERVLSVSGTSGLTLTDAGANGAATLTINNNVVATVSGTTFTGVVSASAGFSGSLTRIATNIPYLLSQGGITLTTTSLGQVIISGSSGAGTGAPVSSQYLVLSADGTLTAERTFTAGTGLTGTDAGGNSTYTLAINNNVVATVSGTTFTGVVSGAAGYGFSGSLTRIATNIPYLLSQGGITLTTTSLGQIIISGSTGGSGGAPATSAYVTIGNDAVLTNERALTSSWGNAIVDNGAGSTVYVNEEHTIATALAGDLTCSLYFSGIDASGGARSICLPDATTNTGKTYYIKKTVTAIHNITVTTINASTQLIDNATSDLIENTMQVKGYISDGANWWVLSSA